MDDDDDYDEEGDEVKEMNEVHTGVHNLELGAPQA